MREDVPLEELLLTVERELLGADGAHLPVALDVLLEAALLKVRREDHLAQRAALVNVTTGVKAEAAPGFTASVGLMITGLLSPISHILWLLWWMLEGLGGTCAAGRLDADHLSIPAWCSRARARR